MKIPEYKATYPASVTTEPTMESDILIDTAGVSKITKLNNIFDIYKKPISTVALTSNIDIEANKYYSFTNMQSTTITLIGNDLVDNMVREYTIIFTTNGTPPTIIWPISVKWIYNIPPTFLANKTYEISIVNNLGIYATF